VGRSPRRNYECLHKRRQGGEKTNGEPRQFRQQDPNENPTKGGNIQQHMKKGAIEFLTTFARFMMMEGSGKNRNTGPDYDGSQPKQSLPAFYKPG